MLVIGKARSSDLLFLHHLRIASVDATELTVFYQLLAQFGGRVTARKFLKYGMYNAHWHTMDAAVFVELSISYPLIMQACCDMTMDAITVNHLPQPPESFSWVELLDTCMNADLVLSLFIWTTGLTCLMLLVTHKGGRTVLRAVSAIASLKRQAIKFFDDRTITAADVRSLCALTALEELQVIPCHSTIL
jgi:hypothetical protein